LLVSGCRDSSTQAEEASIQSEVREQRDHIANFLENSAVSDLNKFPSEEEQVYFAAFHRTLLPALKFDPARLVSLDHRSHKMLMAIAGNTHEDPSIRAAFLIILGRKKALDVLSEMIQLAKTEKQQSVREAALVSIGMAQNEAAKEFLATVTPRNLIVLLAQALSGDEQPQKDYLESLTRLIQRATEKHKAFVVRDRSPVQPLDSTPASNLPENVEVYFRPTLVLTGTSYLSDSRILPLLIESQWLSSSTRNPRYLASELLRVVIPEVPLARAPLAIDRRYEFLKRWWEDNKERIHYVPLRRRFESIP
jgi:hypothetical protein